MSPVGRQLAAVRRRAVGIVVLRALAGAVGAGLLALLLAAWLTGPVASVVRATFGWGLVLAAAGAAFAWLARPALRWRGGGASSLYAGVRDGLASRARSALELGTDARAVAHAPALVLAHARRVATELAAIPAGRVVPARALFDRRLGLAAIVAVAAAALIAIDGRATAGAWALAHPAGHDAQGTPLASVVAHVRVRVIPPGYTGTPPVDLVDPTRFGVTKGSTLEVHVSPRLASRGGTVALGGEHAPLGREPDGGLVARLVAREGGPLVIALATAAGRVRDGGARTVELQPDRAPRASIDTPAADETVDAGEDVVVGWSAKDDHGLAAVELVVRAPDGHETRRRLDAGGGRPRLEARGSLIVSPRALGARAGDTIVLRVEARDHRRVGRGPAPARGRAARRPARPDARRARRAPRVGAAGHTRGGAAAPPRARDARAEPRRRARRGRR